VASNTGLFHPSNCDVMCFQLARLQ
jgi:hypothetical protein